jgi:hypothetical protein
MKSKFQNFDFGAVEILSREEAAKVKGGAYGAGQYGGGWGAFEATYSCICKIPGAFGATFATTSVEALSCARAKEACGAKCITDYGAYDSKTGYNGHTC